MKFIAELDRETDGRFIAEIASLPGVLAYGATVEEASTRVEVLALRVLANRLELTATTAASSTLPHPG